MYIIVDDALQVMTQNICINESCKSHHIVQCVMGFDWMGEIDYDSYSESYQGIILYLAVLCKKLICPIICMYVIYNI